MSFPRGVSLSLTPRDASGSCAAAISLPDDLLHTIPSPLLTGSAVEQLGETSEGPRWSPESAPVSSGCPRLGL
ncbi:UNVERIFIED_CONTAM: hypothetical protein FKN15_067309 [Acipenser sinensis]